MRKKTRLNLSMTGEKAVSAMSDGNPGAINVMMLMIAEAEWIDPDSLGGPTTFILWLDTWGIYGSRIYMLWADVCNKNLPRMLAVLRALQLGFISEAVINYAIDNLGEGLDVAECVRKVHERLPNFRAEMTGLLLYRICFSRQDGTEVWLTRLPKNGIESTADRVITIGLSPFTKETSNADDERG